MRAKQTIELTAEGPLTCSVLKLTWIVLERIIIHSNTYSTVWFLGGIVKEACFS